MRRARTEPGPDRDLGPEADPESVARTILLDQLTGRARTRSELATKLSSRGVPDDISARLLDRFEEVGLVDDAAFAREWVEQRQSGRGLAKRALAQELRRKGVDDDLAADALATVDDDAERAKALELAARKARVSRGQPHEKRVRSLAGMLARKGYSSSVAFGVVREVLAAEGDSEELIDLELS